MHAQILLLCLLAASAQGQWTRLEPLPDKEGFAGAFAGVSADSLIVAGGTNFPDKMPWEGGVKRWYDDVHVLRDPAGKWEKAGRLPRPNGYGVSLTTQQGVLLIGGGDVQEHFRSVWKLWLEGVEARFDRLPDLPRPCAFMAGVASDGIVYVAGGIERPADMAALATFWALDLSRSEAGWKQLEPCPGPARILASMAAADGRVYLFSGASLKQGADGKAEREWLKDGWCYSASAGWRKVAALAHAAVAAPSPLPGRDGRLFLIGGDDGSLVNFEPKDKHPGFPWRILAYDPAKDRWSTAGEVPFSRVTTPAVEWRGRVVIPGGEARPGKRSPEVWQGLLRSTD
jgi:N-acetylneuraminic acid mutarotase